MKNFSRKLVTKALLSSFSAACLLGSLNANASILLSCTGIDYQHNMTKAVQTTAKITLDDNYAVTGNITFFNGHNQGIIDTTQSPVTFVMPDATVLKYQEKYDSSVIFPDKFTITTNDPTKADKMVIVPDSFTITTNNPAASDSVTMKGLCKFDTNNLPNQFGCIMQSTLHASQGNLTLNGLLTCQGQQILDSSPSGQ